MKDTSNREEGYGFHTKKEPNILELLQIAHFCTDSERFTRGVFTLKTIQICVDTSSVSSKAILVT